MVFDGLESSTNTTREFSSSSTNVEDKQDVPFSRVYTHPLSQVVLEHLQNVHGDWLVRKGLHRGLTINRGKELRQGLRPCMSCTCRRWLMPYFWDPTIVIVSTYQ